MQARLMLHPTAFKCRNTTNLFANAHANKGSADEKSIRGRVPRGSARAMGRPRPGKAQPGIGKRLSNGTLSARSRIARRGRRAIIPEILRATLNAE
jgi:hypothetical protein